MAAGWSSAVFLGIFTHMTQLLKKWTDEELEESLIQVGPQLPVYIKGGFVVDGKRKQAMCRRLQIPIDIVQLPTEFATLKILWAHHPDRAIERIGKNKTVEEYSAALAVKPAQVAEVLQALRGGKKKKRSFKGRAESIVTSKYLFNLRITPSAKALLKEAAEVEHRSIGDLMRLASVAYAKKILGPGRTREIIAGARHLDVEGPIARSLRDSSDEEKPPLEPPPEAARRRQ